MREDAGATLSRDTSPVAERMQIDRWRGMSPTEKLRIVSKLTQATRELSMAGIRLRHPHASHSECELEFAILTLGPDLAARAYPQASTTRQER